MTPSRKKAILLETIKFDIEVIESVLDAIKNWYGSTRKTLSDSQATCRRTAMSASTIGTIWIISSTCWIEPRELCTPVYLSHYLR